MKFWRTIVLAIPLWLGVSAARAADLVAVPELGLRIQRGFQISLFADNDLAADTFCMTLDVRGRVVIANSKSIRTLSDTDGDGVADTSTIFAPLERGAMGMCFDGTSLYVAGDGWLSRYDDADGNGIADGPPERLLPLAFAEHGGHAMRKGPDGWWYLIGGNDTGFNERHTTLAGSPITKVEAGALLRLTPDGRNTEVIAHGFRNPYDFDFNFVGDIFTYDSDVERDVLLPWYMPTRVYHVGFAQHHGWRLSGHQRSWPRPAYYSDTVELLSAVGRGSPTGVTCYRHFQFPLAYRGGLFLCDWTFGYVFFLPLEPNGTSYSEMAPEHFIEPMGAHGFAPTDIAVAPDGSLFISIGGRKTRGAVYHVRFAGIAPSIPPVALNVELNSVLLAPQPLDAWSRALWVPVAARLGAQPFLATVTDESTLPEVRVRAIEILTELFGGLPPARARAAVQSRSEIVRARVAWSLGRLPGENATALLLVLANDVNSYVRRCALEAMLDRLELVDGPGLIPVLAPNLSHQDKRVRMAAAGLASRLSETTWQALTSPLPRTSPAIATAALAQAWRTPDVLVHPEIIPPLTNLLAQTRDPLTRLDTLRVIILALGDWHLNNPSVEVYTAYETAAPFTANPDEIAALRRNVGALLPSGNAQVDMEAFRLLAMLEDDDRQTPRLLMNYFTEASSAASDFHYLVCLSRLRGDALEFAPRIAHVILSLDRKLRGQEMRSKHYWDPRLVEVTQQLLRRYPAIAAAMLRHPQFATAAHVAIANTLSGERRIAAARRFLAVARANANFPWSTDLIGLFSVLPSEEVLPLFRRQWSNVILRDELLPRIAEKPVAGDREKFLAALGSTQSSVVRAALTALIALPPDPSNTNLVAPLKLLNRALADSADPALRGQLVTLLATNLRQNFNIQEPANTDPTQLKAAYQSLFNFIATRYPGLWRAVNAEDVDDPVRWRTIIKAVPWDGGNAARGQTIFVQRGCQPCHNGVQSIGPDIGPAVQRMSREDLLETVIFPSRDIAPPYRTMMFRTRDGQSYTGIVAFESADGWIVQTGAGTTARLNSADVVSRQPGSVSLMPSGLLSGLSAMDLADLYSYLRTLTARQ